MTQLRLTSIFRDFFNLAATVSAKQAVHSQRRRLLAEQLEPRFALSTMAGGDAPTDAPPSENSTNANPAETNSAPADPNSAPTNPPPANPPGGGTNNATPQIVNFAYTIEEGWYILRGHVIDDQDPTGGLVNLSGLILASSYVAVDDYFTYRFQWTPETNGTITATFQDMYGLTSTPVSITV